MAIVTVSAKCWFRYADFFLFFVGVHDVIGFFDQIGSGVGMVGIEGDADAGFGMKSQL